MVRSFALRCIAVITLTLLPLTGGCQFASDKMVISNARQMHGDLTPAIVTDPVLANYVKALGDRVVETARELARMNPGSRGHESGEDNAWMFQNVRFHLVNSDTLNAFTTGGEHVYLYTELLRTCRTEDEFAAVVAHEFAHIYGRHVHNSYNNAITIQMLAIGAAVGAMALDSSDEGYIGTGIAGVAVIGGQLVALNYGRKDEDEADKLGFRFYTRAGWDPEQFPGFFQTLIDKGHDSGPNLLSSHPRLSDRVANTRRRIRELPPDAPSWRQPNVVSQREFERLQARATEVGRTMPSDRSLAAAQKLLAAFPSCVSPKETADQAQARAELLYTYGTEEQREQVEQQQQQKQIPTGPQRDRPSR